MDMRAFRRAYINSYAKQFFTYWKIGIQLVVMCWVLLLFGGCNKSSVAVHHPWAVIFDGISLPLVVLSKGMRAWIINARLSVMKMMIAISSDEDDMMTTK
jgi:hypothetical protein